MGGVEEARKMEFVDKDRNSDITDRFSELSSRDLKNLLQAKCLELSEEEALTVQLSQRTIVEKDGLIRLCKRCIDEDDITRLLNSDMRPTESSILTSATHISMDEDTKRKKGSFTKYEPSYTPNMLDLFVTVVLLY